MCKLKLTESSALQDQESSSELKQDKPKADDPIVDLFPDDDAEERNSKF